MLIKVDRKKLLTALKRVTAIVKDPLLDKKYEPLTIMPVGEKELVFTFTNLDLQVRFSINAESVDLENEVAIPLGLDASKFQGIVSSMTDDIVHLKYSDPMIYVFGEEADKNSSFSIPNRVGYYSENKFDTSELEEDISHIEIDEVKLVTAISSLLECPTNERDYSGAVLFYKGKEGSTCCFTTTGAVVIHYDFIDSSYNFPDSFAVLRKNMAYIASLCDCNSISIYNGKYKAYFKINDTIIGDGYEIFVISKKILLSSIPNPSMVIAEKPIQFYVNSDVLNRVLNRANLIDGPGCDLSIVGSTATISSTSNIENYSETFDVIPISHSIDCSISFNHKLLMTTIKKQKRESFKVELTNAMILITNDERDLISVLATQRKQ